ncbi:MAG TPA: hypothetical protein VN380_18165 [Thermoanaerobaculia bacterium]|jgi:hypothetical protein|nr:hypothetical protein [Thermoanaerobaculia bacterium]
MPKYRVFIAETEVFDIDVEACDEADAHVAAMKIFATTSRNSVMHHSAAMFAAPLSDEAEVENEH